MGRPRISKSSVSRTFDQVSFPIFLIDNRRIISYCNPACVKWVGAKSEDDLIGVQCDYHSHTGKPSSIAAGLCPPLEAFHGDHLRANVFNLQRESKSAQFVPLPANSHQTIGILVLVDDCDAERISNAGTAKSNDVHSRLAKIRKDFMTNFQIDRIAGTSAVAQRIQNQIQLACLGRPHVAAFGPKGSGREHLLRTIYGACSDVNSHPLVPLTCELLDAELLQTTIEAVIRSCAELEMDAFGTLLLLEADHLAKDAQSELVGFLSIPELQIQVLTTSRISLIEMANQGEYRSDLAYLLSTLQIEIPSLKERPEDIKDLVQAQLETLNARGEKQVSGLTPETLDQLNIYGWPGNIDELFETVAQAHRQCDGDYIQTHHLPETIHLAKQAAMTTISVVESIELDPFLEKIEIELIQRALKQSRGNKTKAAKLLGINRGRMLRRLDHFGLTDESNDENG